MYGCLAFSFLFGGVARAQPRTEILWPDGAPGALGAEEKDRPRLQIWSPPKKRAARTAIVVCPGGGYGNLALGHEGREIAEWLNDLGVVAAVLEYRHRGKRYGHPSPMLDAQRALRWVRSHAAELGVETNRVGMLGFSAGGHLASTVGTHFDAGNSDAADPVDRVSCRPDFLILGYPVISFTAPYTHAGSRRNLLGDDPPDELLRKFSNELQVTPETPPTFLMHTSEDQAVPPENSVAFYLALRQAGVPAELHIYERGRHGVGLAREVPGANQWPAACAAWLKSQGLLSANRKNR